MLFLTRENSAMQTVSDFSKVFFQLIQIELQCWRSIPPRVSISLVQHSNSQAHRDYFCGSIFNKDLGRTICTKMERINAGSSKHVIQLQSQTNQTFKKLPMTMIAKTHKQINVFFKTYFRINKLVIDVHWNYIRREISSVDDVK